MKKISNQSATSSHTIEKIIDKKIKNKTKNVCIKGRVCVSFYMKVDADSEEDLQNLLYDVRKRIINEHCIPTVVSMSVASYTLKKANTKLSEVAFAHEGSYHYIKL